MFGQPGRINPIKNRAGREPAGNHNRRGRPWRIAASGSRHPLVEAEFVSQIDSLHFRIGGEFDRCSAPKDPAVVDDVSPIGNLQGLSGIVIGDENSDSTIRQPADQFSDFQNRNRIDSRKGLVEQHEIRVEGQTAGDFGSPSFATGEAVCARSRQSHQTEFPEKLRRLFFPLRSAEVGGFEHRQNVVPDRHSPENRRFLRKIPDSLSSSLIHRKIGDVGSGKKNAALIRPHEPDHHSEGRGLAGSVGTKQAHDFTGGQTQRNVVDHAPPPELFDEVASLEEGVSGSLSSALGSLHFRMLPEGALAGPA